MRLALASVVTALAALVTAHTPPNYNKGPEGNAIIQPALDTQVPVGEPYTIKWTPTTKGPISLVLLRGPSSNVKPLRTIAETIPNDGSFVWTPATDLEDDVTHYGLLLVVEGTGQYQWSAQFGIQNPGNNGGGNTQTSQQSSTTPTGGTTEPSNTATGVTSKTKSACRMTTSTGSATHAPVTTTSATNGGSGSGSASASSSGAEQPTTMTTAMPSETAPSGPGESSSPSGSQNPSEPSSPASSSGPAVPTYTGAAGRNSLSMGAVAAGAFAVLAF